MDALPAAHFSRISVTLSRFNAAVYVAYLVLIVIWTFFHSFSDTPHCRTVDEVDSKPQLGVLPRGAV